ncbi:MAG: preprotein translocase subunit SecY, partial [Planctomycetes bacterium]|nr:preprotein translocase subunit SecY [Planctomycetota bacterium]
MLQTILNIFKVPELYKKLGFTLGLLCIYRIGFYVPIPGVNQVKMARSSGGGLGDLAEYFAIFTGGSLQQSTIFGLGIMPYISASIIFQLLVTVVPSLEKLQQEGDTGRRKIQEYTRYATVGLCLINAAVWMKYLAAQGFLFPQFEGQFLGMSFTYMAMSLIVLTTGTVFLMWLGEQIDEYGIGNGISLIIMAGIVVQLPNAVIYVVSHSRLKGTADAGELDLPKILFLVVMFVAVVAGAILIMQAQRRIPIQQAKQTRGRRVYGGQRHYLPIRVNQAGVMPVIFASALLAFPPMVLTAVGLTSLASAMAYGQYLWSLCYVLLTYFFAS